MGEPIDMGFMSFPQEIHDEVARLFDPLLIVTGDPAAGHRYARKLGLGPHQYVVVCQLAPLLGRTSGRYVVLDRDGEYFAQIMGCLQAPAFREEPKAA